MLTFELKIFSKLLFISIIPCWLFAQSEKLELFNGIDVDNWHTQGLAEWEALDGEIHGVHSGEGWAHLISDQTFTDATIRLKYKITRGNSGIYIRTTSGGEFGVVGIQVEAGGGDGMAMYVTADTFVWLPYVEGQSVQVNTNDWNDMLIELEGQSFTSYINGVKVTEIENLPEDQMPAEGSLAFQLHIAGEPQEGFYKDIEVFTPRLITGCTDSTYEEFDPDANDLDSAACVTRVVVNVLKDWESQSVKNVNAEILKEYLKNNPRIEIFNVSGKIMGRQDFLSAGNYSGVYFLREPGKPLHRLLLVP